MQTPEYKNVVYISHPYSGIQANKDKITAIVKELQSEHPDWLIVSPVHAFSVFYKDVDYYKGLNMCLWLLERCDEMYVYGNWRNSIGCNAEIEYCKQRGIPYFVKENS